MELPKEPIRWVSAERANEEGIKLFSICYHISFAGEWAMLASVPGVATQNRMLNQQTCILRQRYFNINSGRFHVAPQRGMAPTKLPRAMFVTNLPRVMIGNDHSGVPWRDR